MAGKYEIDMCEGKVLPKIIKFAFPMIMTSVLQLLYNAVDIIVVGRFVGETALAAVGSTSSLINLIVNLLIGLSVGASIVASQYIGANNRIKTYDTVHTAMLIAIIGGVIFSVVGFTIAKPVLVLTGSPDNVINQATLYMKIYFLGTPALMIGNFGSALLRSIGDTKRPFYIFSLSGILNAVLNLIFVINFNMDVAGVAIATIISQYISAILVVLTMTKTDGFITLHLKELQIKKDISLEILKKGIPVGLQSFIFSCSNVIIQSSVNSFGSVVMAGSSAAANIEGFLYVILNSFSVVTTTFVGQNYGAKKYKRIDKTLCIGMGLVTAIGILATLVFVAFQRDLLAIYAPGNEAAINAGIIRMKYIFNLYFLCGIMEVFVGGLRGLGKTVIPMLVSVVAIVGARIMWVYTVFASIKTLDSLFISYPISWSIAIIILFFSYLTVRRKLFNVK